MPSPVNFALLYRTPKEWRITVGTSDELACGALEATSSTESFQAAAREFEALLASEWGIVGPLAWEEFKPDWWGVEWVSGSLDAERETRT